MFGWGDVRLPLWHAWGEEVTPPWVACTVFRQGSGEGAKRPKHDPCRGMNIFLGTPPWVGSSNLPTLPRSTWTHSDILFNSYREFLHRFVLSLINDIMKPTLQRHKVNSFVACYMHVVFSTRMRQPYLTPDIQPKLFAYIAGIIRQRDCTPIIVNGMADHVHILFRMSPTKTLSDIVREIKKASHYYVKQLGYHVQWQSGYSAFSVSSQVLQNVYNYIDHQKEHHHDMAYLEEIRSMEAQAFESGKAYIQAHADADKANG